MTGTFILNASIGGDLAIILKTYIKIFNGKGHIEMKSDVVRKMVDKQIAERNQMALAVAAQTLLPDYQTDSELTAFQSLAGDDFLDVQTVIGTA